MATPGHPSSPSAQPTVGDYPGPANKAPRRQKDAAPHIQDDDWISGLPDEMLIYILTILSIKDAAIMGCVSRRWRHLWKHIPDLMLNGHSVCIKQPENPDPQTWHQLRHTRATEFIVKVNTILQQRHGTRIELFTVDFPLTSKHAPEVDRWVKSAAECGVKMLKLKLARLTTYRRPYDFPLQCFAGGRGSSLRNLILCNCELSCSPKCLEGFRSLKYLVLNKVSVADVDMMSIFATCSALGLLQLKKCNGLVDVRISHAELRCFYVECCSNVENINIHAEKLSVFAYMGHMVDVVYGSAPVLHTLRIHFLRSFSESGNECPLDCIGTLPALKILHLQFNSPSMSSLALQHYQTFAGLKEILLSFLTSWNENILLVPYLLIAAPLIERLQLEAYNAVEAPKDLTIKWPEHVSFGSLQSVIVGGFSGETEMMELTSYLLRRSPALKMLKIYTHPMEYKGGQKWSRVVDEDHFRCYYARGVAWTHLAPKVPSTVKFTIE